MPRYFFHVEDEAKFPDAVGTVLRDLAEARVEAVKVSGELLRDSVEKFWSAGKWRITVTDHQQKIMFALNFEAEEPSATTGRYQIVEANCG